jgi:hypothetical protein
MEHEPFSALPKKKGPSRLVETGKYVIKPKAHESRQISSASLTQDLPDLTELDSF